MIREDKIHSTIYKRDKHLWRSVTYTNNANSSLQLFTESMSVFHVFKIERMWPNWPKHLIFSCYKLDVLEKKLLFKRSIWCNFVQLIVSVVEILPKLLSTVTAYAQNKL